MSRLHETVVQDQFGPRAEAYVQSAVHAAGEDLDALEAVARREVPERAIDIGSGGGHVAYRLAPAENLPFDDASFDFAASRFSAHHWRDFEAGLRQARRVLKPGSTAIFIDVVAPGFAALDTHLQAVELLRDPSHIRDYTSSEWEAALARAGFRVRNTQMRRLRMDYPTWVERMRTSEAHRVAIRSLQQHVSSEIAAYYGIEPDGSFTLDTLQIEAVA